MSVGAYMSSKAQHDAYHKHLKLELEAVNRKDKRKIESLRKIYSDKGFSDLLLDNAVEQIMLDRNHRVDVIMKEELSMNLPDTMPLYNGLSTFTAFVVV